MKKPVVVLRISREEAELINRVLEEVRDPYSMYGAEIREILAEPLEFAKAQDKLLEAALGEYDLHLHVDPSCVTFLPISVESAI